MSRAKILIVACCTVFAASAFVSATALAGEWDVGGTSLNGSAALAPTALVLAFGKLLVPTANTTIECFAHEILIHNGSISSPDRLLVESITFHECEAVGTGGCSIEPLISTVPIHGLAHLDGTLNALILLLPETKNTFATIKFNGEKCALLGTQPVTQTKATVDLLIHQGQDSALLHLVLAFSLPGALRVGSSEAILEGLDFDIALASDKTWAFL